MGVNNNNNKHLSTKRKRLRDKENTGRLAQHLALLDAGTLLIISLPFSKFCLTMFFGPGSDRMTQTPCLAAKNSEAYEPPCEHPKKSLGMKTCPNWAPPTGGAQRTCRGAG